jgi:signal transduction histidine kinase
VRRVPIRLKLAGALAVPLPALVAVALFEVADTAADRSGVRQQTELAIATTGPTGVVTALQNERAWLAVELVGFDDIMTVPVEGYDETRSATDAAIDNFRADLEGRSPVIAEAYDEALAGLAELDEVRADVDANTAPRDIENLVFSDLIFTRYTGLVEPFLDATARISLGVDDQELRHGTRLAHTTAEQIEVMNQLLNMLIRDGGYNDGISTPPEIVAVTQLRARFEDNAARLMTAVGPYGPIIAEHFPADVTERVVNEIHRVVAVELIEDGRVVVEAFDAPADAGYPALQEALSAEIDRRAGQLNRSAAARQRWFVGLAVLALGGTWVLAWAVARSITGPLRSLTRQAVAMAQDHLPRAVRGILDTPLGSDVAVPEVEPVRVSTRDEVADVADALNTVQNTALQLASEQAVLRRNLADSFVNLGRRNQNLLDRQIDFITQLEASETEFETDGDTLGNLFKLDHLATRMRRNAESLLVLAGIAPPRQWAAPVQLTDVIRAAVGEVEDYERVAVRDVEPATVLGTAASDVAHLLAELIENALVFSGPGQAVTVRGRHRHDGGYTLAVIDLGPGMPAPELDAANRRLSGHESFTVAPSKYLGHYVAGNLAARHRIHVGLQSEGRGVTAAVIFPPHLLGHSTVPVPPVAGRPGGEAGPARPPALAATPPSPARSRRRTS